MTLPAQALDLSLQRACERALGNRRGAVVVLSPRDGRVLALVNPDLAVRQTRPPGSAVKLVTAYAAVTEGIADEHRAIVCRNGKSFGTEYRRCWRQPGHGSMTLVPAIANSCNIYFLTVGHELGPVRLARAFGLFRLARRTGVDLAGEVAGSLPRPRSLAEKLDMAIGEGNGFGVTPLQMAVLVAAIASGGTFYRPHLGPARPVILGHLPGTVRSRRALDYVREGMRQATLHGNAVGAAVPGLQIAGKTGTSTFADGSKRTHAWFVGYAPADAPRLALAVYLEEGTGYGDAAPLARLIYTAWRRKAPQ